jgi:ABC-type branched-subunit amino acid transport system substrate-binding protein
VAKRGPASVVAVALCAAALIGCPGRTKRQVGPDIPLPTDGDQQALERFRETRARFERDGKVPDSTAALAEFEAIARDYPEDPIAAHALLYAGMAALEAGKPDRAADNLRELVKDEDANPAVVRRGQLFLGVSLGYLGKHEQALAALKAGADTLDTGSADERADFHAAFAEASAATGNLGDALVHYDAWYPVGRAAERAYSLARVRALADQLDERAVGEVYGKLTGKQGPGAALVGARLAAQLEAKGDRDRAEEVRGEIREAREKLGLATSTGGGAAGDAEKVGGILSLSGKRNRLGDFSMRGLALAAGTFEDIGEGAARLGFPRPFRLSVRDDASQGAGAAGAVDALAAEGVIAIVGPDDGRAVERAARRATDLGVPLVSLHPAAELLQGADSPVVFHVVHSAERRARALARQALEAGIRDFAILAPDSGYGRQVGGAFKSEVQRGGGQVVVEVKFKPEATSFAGEIGKLKKPFQALFVPAQAKQLELIAPALAAGNLNARPPGEKSKQGRSIWLLSTADLVGPHYLQSAGRYSWGALLAPGFYADRTDSRIAEFTALYEASFGRAPTALDAYAFDAAWLIRAAVDGGAKNRRDVAAQLAVTKLVGLTGPIAFDSGHRRRDDGIVYEVVQVRNDQYELKARR